jgi:hypothetical protein
MTNAVPAASRCVDIFLIIFTEKPGGFESKLIEKYLNTYGELLSLNNAR